MSIELILQEAKTSIEAIGKNFEEYKHTAETARKDHDVLLETKLAKLSTDITTKHDEITKQLNDVVAKEQRPKATDASVTKAQDNANLFSLCRRDIQQATRRDSGQYEPNVEQTASYGNAFTDYTRLGKDSLAPEVLKDLSIGSDPDGGYWILPPEISQTVVRRIYETSPIRQVATVQTIGTREYVVPEDPSDVGAGWIAERGPVTQTTTMQVSRKVIPAYELYAEPVITTQMIEDAMIDISAYLAMKIADKVSRLENTAFVLGTGQGQPRGLLTYAAGAPNANVWGTQISQIGTGSSGVFTYSGIVNLITSIKDKYQAGAEFLIKRQSVPSLMTITDGASRLIFQPILNGAFNSTPLLGYKINYATDMPSVAAGALALAFGDFKAAYLIVDRIGLSTIRDNLTNKPNVMFYTRKRTGGDVVDFDAYVIQVLT